MTRSDYLTSRTQTTGGNFFYVDFGILIDFSKTSAMVDLIWRGPLDNHCTTMATLGEDCERWGSSMQVSQRMWNWSVENADNEDVVPEEDESRDWFNIAH